jgi:hypothetical protein
MTIPKGPLQFKRVEFLLMDVRKPMRLTEQVKAAG